MYAAQVASRCPIANFLGPLQLTTHRQRQLENHADGVRPACCLRANGLCCSTQFEMQSRKKGSAAECFFLWVGGVREVRCSGSIDGPLPGELAGFGEA